MAGYKIPYDLSRACEYRPHPTDDAGERRPPGFKRGGRVVADVHWSRPVTGVLVVATAVGVVGSVLGLAAVLDASAAAATVAVVAVAVVLVTLAGIRGLGRLSTPYW